MSAEAGSGGSEVPTMRWILTAALAAVGLAGAAWPANGKSVLRFGGSYAAPTGDVTEPTAFTGVDLGNGTMLAFDGTLTLEPREATAPTIDYEYRFSERLGIDVTVLRASADLDGRLRGTYWINDSTTGELLETGPLDETAGVGDSTYLPLTLGANFHLTPSSKLDVYMAPAIGYVFYDDMELSGEKVAVKDDLAWGATAGLDVPIGKGHWLLNVALRYLSTEAEIDEPGGAGEALDVSPFVLQLAAGYRF